MRTILSIVGARPQFVKHAALHAEHFNAHTLHTGQHYDENMSGIFFDEFHMPAPDYRLDLTGAKTQSQQTAIMLTGIEKVCNELWPDAVLLYGDTNSTLAGALVAAKLNIPSIHVEAGIRSFNRAMPEEVNRIVADTFATLLFCPVQEAVDNLGKEGIHHQGVYLVGDVMCDMLTLAQPHIRQMLDFTYYFCTIHRPYNTDDPERLLRILKALNQLQHPVVFPLHPRTNSRMDQDQIRQDDYPNVRFIEPIGYLDCISYQNGAACVITDSGGIQKEAYILQRKCLTIRSETEWNGTLRHGWNTLVFEDIERISELVDAIPEDYVPGMFGDGRSAQRISRIIAEYFCD
jgi:UDP-GlcNAc3NAcA epimerase